MQIISLFSVFLCVRVASQLITFAIHICLHTIATRWCVGC